MIRVMVVDDQELIRQSLKVILSVNADMEVVGIAGDGSETLKVIEECRPDVVLMDIRMPVMDGVECTARIKEKHPEIKVIALTTFDDDEFVFCVTKRQVLCFKGIDLAFDMLCAFVDIFREMKCFIDSFHRRGCVIHLTHDIAHFVEWLHEIGGISEESA